MTGCPLQHMSVSSYVNTLDMFGDKGLWSNCTHLGRFQKKDTPQDDNQFETINIFLTVPPPIQLK